MLRRKGQKDSEPRFARQFMQTLKFLLAQTYSRTPLASLIGFELYYASIKKHRTVKTVLCFLAGAEGFEPTTNGFGDRDSTS